MLKRLKEKLRQRGENQRIRKKLGSNFYTIDIPDLRNFGLVVIDNGNGLKGLLNQKESGLEVVCPFATGATMFNYWIDSIDRDEVIVQIGDVAFRKKTWNESVSKIKELCYCNECEKWGKKFVIFRNRRKDNYILLNLENFEMQEFCSLLAVRGLKALGNLTSLKGWIYTYFDGSLKTAGLFKKAFQDGEQYQINSLANERNETIYEINSEGFNVVADVSWKEVSEIPNLPGYYIGSSGKENNMIKIAKDSFGIYKIPKGEIQPIGKVFRKKYYKILGDGTVYLMSLDKEGKPIILAQYKGENITFSEPILDFEKGEIKKQIFVWQHKVGQQ